MQNSPSSKFPEHFVSAINTYLPQHIWLYTNLSEQSKGSNQFIFLKEIEVISPRYQILFPRYQPICFMLIITLITQSFKHTKTENQIV